MNPTTQDIKDILEDSIGVAELSFGTNLFIGIMPDTPDSCVGLYDTGGMAPDEAIEGLLYPTFQVRVRGAEGGYQTAYALAQSVRNALHQLANQTFNGTRYLYIFASSDILFLGPDEKGRPLFSINFRTAKT